MAFAFTSTTFALPPVIVGSAYNQTIGTSGGTGPLAFAIAGGNFPAWATLNPTTGAITGTPPSDGMYVFVVQATDSSATPQVIRGTFSFTAGYTLISDIATWVTGDYLKRGDITNATVAAAADVYRITTAKVPFENLVQLTDEIPLVSGQDTYDLSTIVPPLLGITDIRLTINSTTRRRLRRSSGRLYDSLSVLQPGQPATYARTAGKQIQLNPPPNSNTMTMRIRYWTRPTEGAVAGNSGIVLATPLEWNALFKWETAWWMLNELGQEQRAATLVMPMMTVRQPTPKKQHMMEIGIIPRLWNELLTTMSQKENVDEDFGINPVIRAYSYAG